MHNFGRALRLSLRYRVTFATSLVCALIVAVLWGGNLGAVYPVVEVVFQGNSLHDWVDRETTSAETTSRELIEQIARWEVSRQGAPPAQRAQLEHQIDQARDRLSAEQAALARFRWIAPWVHRYLPESSFQTLVLVIGALIVGTTIKSVFYIADQVLVAKLANLAIFDLRKQFYRRTLRMHLASFGDRNTTELMTRFTYDMESLSAGIKALFGKVVREPLKMIACLVGAGLICWRLLVLTLLVAPLFAYLVGGLARSLKRANRRALENMSQVYNILDETFGGIKVVKAFTMEGHERRRFHLNSKSFYAKAMKIAWYDSLTRPLTEVLGMVTIGLALLAGAYLVLSGETHVLGIRLCDRPLTRSSLLLFYAMLAGISDPARKLSEVFSSLQRAAAAADRIYALLDRQPTVVDPLRPRPAFRHSRDLALENVSFEYHPGQRALEHVSLRVPFGETIAVVGPNGCGKTTLVNLLPRFFDPAEGRVLIDGVDLRQMKLRDLRRQIGLVNQETLLFDDTVYNNIRYGSLDATRQQIIEAAQQAHAHRFIEERLPQGYDTVVGLRGGNLSGGQRQRIALARAILRDPAILILDEATSQIDLESEQLIQRVLEKFTRDRTTFIITHRLGTLALADRILVMDAGRVLDLGTHDELLRRCPLYARLHTIDFRQSA